MKTFEDILLSKLEKTFILRHFLFCYFEIKRAIVYRNTYSPLGVVSFFIKAFYLRFLRPYLELIKKKLFWKNQQPQKDFNNEYSREIYEKGYVILPKINLNQINFVDVNVDPQLRMSDNFVDIEKACPRKA